MINDPTSMPSAKFPFDEDGKAVPFRLDWKDHGEFLVAERIATFFRDNPMGGNYQNYVGAKYQVMEVSSMIIQKNHLLNFAPGNQIPYVANWTRLSPWLPWMEMEGREGMIVLVTQGRSTLAFDDLPEPMRGSIGKRLSIHEAGACIR